MAKGLKVAWGQGFSSLDSTNTADVIDPKWAWTCALKKSINIL